MSLQVSAPPDAQKKPPRSRRTGTSRWVAIAGTWVVVLAVVVPILDVFVESFREPSGLLDKVWSADNYRDLMTERNLEALLLSLKFGLGSTVFATTVGTLLAFLVIRTDVPLRRATELAAYVPFFLSGFLLAVSWQYVGSPHNGLINEVAMRWGIADGPIVNIYSELGVMIVIGISNVPIAFLMVSGALRQMDASLEHAARICGATRLKTSLSITLRLASRGIISAVIITFVLGFEELGVVLALGNAEGLTPLSMRVFAAVHDAFPADYNFAAAASVLILSLPVFAFWLQSRIIGRRARYTVGGKAAAPQRMALGWAKWPATAFCVVWILIAVALPMIALVLTAIQRRWSGTLDTDLLTFDNFTRVFEDTGYSLSATDAFRNSFLLSIVAASLVVIMAVVATYTINRLRMRGGRWAEVILSLPVAIPGTTVAVGLLNLLIQTPLYATLWIIGIAFAIRYFPYGMRPIDASFGSLHPELEEASRVSGLGLFQTLRRVTVPLLRPAMVSGWLMMFVFCMREVAMSALLYTGDNQTLSVALLNLSRLASNGVVAAFTLMQVLLFLGIASLAMLSRGARREALRL